MKHKFPPFVLAVFLIAGCDRTPDDYPGEPSVHAIITVDSTLAKVMVGRTVSVVDTLPIDTVIDTFTNIWEEDTFTYVDTYYVVPWIGVSDADVVLKQGEESFILNEHPDSTGYYYGDIPEPSANQTWMLEISYPAGEEIVAKTTTPGNLEITGPFKDTLYETDTLSWTPSYGAGGYYIKRFVWVNWEEEDSTTTDSFFLWGRLLPQDTTFWALEFLSYLYYDSITFFIYTLDTNYYDYKSVTDYLWWGGIGDIGLGDANIEDLMHIDGAWGVFGSRNIVQSKVYHLPAPDTLLPEQSSSDPLRSSFIPPYNIHLTSFTACN